MQFENTIAINASPATVFAIYADVPNWPQWDVDAKAASIEGAFKTGAVGEIVPHGGPKSKLSFLSVRANEGFTVSCRLPLCEMRFEYELKPVLSGTHATHRTVFTGPLSWFFGRVIGNGMRKTTPQSMAQLKARAESAAG